MMTPVLLVSPAPRKKSASVPPMIYARFCTTLILSIYRRLFLMHTWLRLPLKLTLATPGGVTVEPTVTVEEVFHQLEEIVGYPELRPFTKHSA